MQIRSSIKNTIFQAINGHHWLDITYLNSKQEITKYYFGVTDIDINKGILYGDIFNAFKSLDTRPATKGILIEHIKTASVIEQSFYLVPASLKDKINFDTRYLDYLNVSENDNNILRYLSDCYRNDNDPFLKDTAILNGVDFNSLKEDRIVHLNDEQFKTLLSKVYKANEFKSENINRYAELALNVLAIDINKKTYVVAYRRLALNFKNKTLVMAKKSTVNKSFLLEDKRVSLARYLDIDPNEFASNFDEKVEEYKEMLVENLDFYEKIDTRPQIFLIRRESIKGVDEAFDSIFEMEKTKTLTHPLKCFFGRNKSKGTTKDFNIVVFDKNKININQMRVIYNSMCNHTTYVKGPPGTGKTETIFNVLLSAYANNKTVLVCSNNNHPVDDIFRKMANSLTKKDYYSKQEVQIVFPIVRLGNKEETILAIKKLKLFLLYAKEKAHAVVNEFTTEKSKLEALGNYDELKHLLDQYEEYNDNKIKITSLEKMLAFENISPQFKDKINETIESLKNKLKSYPTFNDAAFSKYAISANDDNNFKNYLYYSSLARIKKLNNYTYKDIKEILEIPDDEVAASELIKFLKDDVNLRRFLDIFPIVICTNLSSDKLGSPVPHFDLCIMDEAGQCNVATSLIPIVRAENLLLVGDTNQLQPVTVIDLTLNELLRYKYNIKDEYDYVNNSILSTMLRMDNNSKQILLSYHYRCGRKIADFVNKRFYNGELNLKNEFDGVLTYVNVKNKRNPDNRNAYEEEAKQVVNLIKKNGYKDVGIITPFRNQANLINKYLKENNITDTKAGTVHTLQGSEKPVIILSSALSPATGKKTMDWIKNNAQLINVGVTRAQKEFVFVGDKETIDALSNNQDNDLKALSEYVYNNGKVDVPPSLSTISMDFSNNSESEKEFFDTIKPYFASRRHKFQISRNVPVKEAIKGVAEEDYKKIGRKEFDVIVKVSEAFGARRYRTFLVFEIDGGEHVGSRVTAYRDRIKEQICAKYKIKLIRIPNHRVRDYELIINMFEAIIDNVKDIDQVEQISLFDFDE